MNTLLEFNDRIRHQLQQVFNPQKGTQKPRMNTDKELVPSDLDLFLNRSPDTGIRIEFLRGSFRPVTGDYFTASARGSQITSSSCGLNPAHTGKLKFSLLVPQNEGGLLQSKHQAGAHRN